jgi:hypothetical protein
MTWLMPIEATSPQPNANTNSMSDFGRMNSPLVPRTIAASKVANGTLSVSSARSTHPVQAILGEAVIEWRSSPLGDSNARVKRDS